MKLTFRTVFTVVAAPIVLWQGLKLFEDLMKMERGQTDQRTSRPTR